MWYLNTFELQRTAHGALYCNCKWLRNITLLPSLIFACPENFLGVMKKTTKIVRVEEWTQGSGSKPEHPKYRAGFQIRVSRCCVKFIACWREAFETVTCKGMERQWRSCEQKCRRQSPPPPCYLPGTGSRHPSLVTTPDARSLAPVIITFISVCQLALLRPINTDRVRLKERHILLPKLSRLFGSYIGF
jgi:hypothetical protein